MKNIEYYERLDSLWFESENLELCNIDDGILSFNIECNCNEMVSLYIDIEEMREIVKLYDGRKDIKEET